MAIKVVCSCGKTLTAKDELAGKNLKCPACQSRLSIPKLKVPPKSRDDDRDLEDVTELQVDEETEKSTLERRAAKPSPSSKPLSRQANKIKRKGTYCQNQQLIIGGLAGGGVLLAILLTWLFWPKVSIDRLGTKLSPEVGSTTASASRDAANASTKGAGSGQTQYLKLPGAVSQPPDWIVAEAPFDIVEFFRPIPIEENAAPLYLETLIEFSTELASLFPEDQQENLIKRYRPRIEKMNRLSQAWNTNRASVSRPELDSLLEEYETGFAKLAEAQKRPRCVFETGITFSSVLPHFQSVRSIARVFGLQTSRDLESGEIKRPLRLLEILLRLNRDMRNRALGITQLSCSGANTLTFKTMTEILDSPHCTKDHCDRLIALLAQHAKEMPDTAGAAIKMEYIVSRTAMRDIEYRTGDFSPEGLSKMSKDFGNGAKASIGEFLATLTESENNPRRAMQIDSQLALMTAADYAREAETLNNYIRELITTARQPFPEAQKNLNLLAGSVSNSVTFNLFQPGDTKPWTTTVFLVPAEAVFLRGTQCLAALRRWQLNAKGVPDDLASVCKLAGMESVPIDPYSGSPFRMTKIDGKPVIYSIGPDLADNQGRLETNRSLIDPTQGDVVFRLAIPFQ